MADFPTRNNWAGGINNRANWKALPPNTVRDSVNLDPLSAGQLALRTGYEQRYAGAAVRGALSVGPYVLIADGALLVAMDTRTNSSAVLASIAAAGRFVGDVLNEELFFCTENETLRFKDGVLRPWGVSTVSSQPVPTVVAGGLLAGDYQCAATFVDAFGDEGGTTTPLLLTVADGAGLLFTLPSPPAGGKVRLYVGSRSGGTLYRQYEGLGPALCTAIDDSTARLSTLNMRAPVVSDFIASHNSLLAMAAGNTLWTTAPMRAHLRTPMRGFFQFSARIDGLLSADDGLFVAADNTYHLTQVETETPAQARVFNYGAVRGSFTLGVDDRALWMTRYGIARSDGAGKAVLLSATNFVPELASEGGSGVLETNGNQLVVTTMRGVKGANPLAASDYYEAEIVPND